MPVLPDVADFASMSLCLTTSRLIWLAVLLAFRQRDQIAAREMVEHLHPLVIRIVRSHLPRRVAEEDLSQEIFLKMFTRLDQYQGAVPFSHWVSRIA